MSEIDQVQRDRRIATALTALRAGDLAKAAAESRQLLAELPDDGAVHQVAAVIALTAGDHMAAQHYAAISLQQRPHHVPTLLVAGRAARSAGDLTVADRHFTAALELEPRRAEAAFLTCVTRLERGDASARALLDRLMRDFPDETDGWFEIGLSLQRAEKPEAALAAFARAHRRAESHLRRGVILRQLGDREAAIAAYEAATTLDPGLAEAWFRLGLGYQDGGEPARAMAAYRRSLSLRPDFAEAAVNLGFLEQDAGDLTTAFALYHQAVLARPESFGRIAQGISASPHGQMWLNLGRLRQRLQS
jgi:tetratricopeptide (TPR) repeat protein